MNDQLYYLSSQKRQTNHVLHLLLCIPTCGLWLFVWGMTMRSNDWHNRKIDRQIKQLSKRSGKGSASGGRESWIDSAGGSKW